MSTDAIVLLKADHQEIRKHFRKFDKAGENSSREGQDRQQAH
jgi:hypothetical protein